MVITNVKVSLLNERSIPTAAKNVMIIMDNKNSFLSIDIDSLIAKGIQIDNSEDLNCIKEISKQLKPSSDSVSNVEFYLKSHDGIRHFTLAILPTACSRHNSPSKAHSLGPLIEKR